jgi:hypothetical protein
VTKLEDLRARSFFKGLASDGTAKVVHVEWFGDQALILATVEVASGFAQQPRYVRQPFQREPDFGATSVTYKLGELLGRAEIPT